MSLSHHDSDNPNWRHLSPMESERSDKNRLKAYGELSVDTAAFIDTLVKHHDIDQIDYAFQFSPETLEAAPVLPEVLAGQTLRDITITTGETNTASADGSPQRVAYLTTEIMTNEGQLYISRSSDQSENAADEPDTFIVLRGLQNNDGVSWREAFQALSKQEQDARMVATPKVSQAELNTLLMSIVLPNNTEYSHFVDKDLLAPETFTFLAESLRNRSQDFNTRGHYLFDDDTTELQFSSVDNDEHFMISYDDPVPHMDRRLIAHATTARGFDMEFSAYNYGSIEKESFFPIIEDIEYIQALINREASLLRGTKIDGPGDVGVDTEAIAIADLGEDYTTPERKTYNDLSSDIEAFLAAQDTNPDTNNED